MAFRNPTEHLDLGILAVVLLLITCGLFSIYSATNISGSQLGQLKFDQQLVWALIGLFVLAAAVFFPLRPLYKYAYSIFGISIILLCIVLVIGSGAGTRRWLVLGAIRIQPAEFAKIASILAIAKYLCQDNRNLSNVRDIVAASGFAFVPLMLIMRQPDLGSALVFVALMLPMMHWAGLSPTILFVLLAPLFALICAFNFYSFFAFMVVICVLLFILRRGLLFSMTNFILNIGVGILTPILWDLLKDYQKNRILTFLGVVTDPRGLGYQVIQSKVAIGSGGMFGKGFLQGTQTQLRFLPEQHTDFVFCVIGEEFGFLGVFVVLTAFAFLVLKGFKVASSVKSPFISLVVFGGTLVLLFQIFVNIGMTVGIVPVTGLPLPFLSYGGSSLLANLVIVGLILNASRKRFERF